MNRITRNDVAERANVSPSTVSRALSNSQQLPKETIERVKKVANELGYQPNLLAKKLATQKSFQLAFAIPCDLKRQALHLDYYSVTLSSCVDAAAKFGYDISIYPYRDDKKSIDRMISMVKSMRLDGFIILGLKVKSKLPMMLKKASVPVIVIGDQQDTQVCSSVVHDPKTGLKELLQRAKGKGYKSLFYIEGDMAYWDAIRQKETLLELLGDSGISLEAVYPGKYSPKATAEIMNRIIQTGKKADFILAANDRSAMGIYDVCFERGMQIPRDVRVVGFDDEKICSIVHPSLTSIQQQRNQAGLLAVKTLLNELDGTTKYEILSLETKYIERESL